MSKMKLEILDQIDVLTGVYNLYAGKMSEFAKELEGKEIYLVGTGASLHACLQAKYAFLKYMGKNVNVVPAYEIEYYFDLFNENSAVFIVSQSGESYETKVAVDVLKEKKLGYFAVTNEETSYLAVNASFVFLCAAGEEVSSGTKTQTATIMIFYLIASMGKQEVLNEIKAIPRKVFETIECVNRYLEDLKNFIGNTQVLYVLGKTVHSGTAQQVALLFKEKIFLHAEGAPLAEFRHGPIEAVHSGSKVIIIASGSENVENVVTHADFLNKECGAEVVLFSDEKSEFVGGYRNYSYSWCSDEQLSHICATIPFQILVESIAVDKNYEVDAFKYIKKVLKQYY